MTEKSWLCRIIDRLPLALRQKRILASKLSSWEELRETDRFGAEFLLQGKVSGDFNPLKARELVLRDMDRKIGAVTLADPEYPQLLAEIHDPPFVLYYRGKLPLFDNSVAVVGTRRPTHEALRETFRYAAELALEGSTVVSGLALGIDAAAHRGALAGHGLTVAVLAGGLDGIHPVSHRALASRILSTGGALVSEFSVPGGSVPNLTGKYLFPRRNRIISGLSPRTVVAQAPERSGALITADFALDQGRDVAILSCGLDELRGGGTRRLHADGAPVIGAENGERERLLKMIGPGTGLVSQEDSARLMGLELEGKVFCGYGGIFVRNDH